MNNDPTILTEKKTYNTPTVTALGDVEQITLGTELGEDLDAAFRTTNAISPRGTKQPKEPIFS